MAPSPRNQFLDAASNSEDDQELGYDSEAAEESRVKRAPKRRKTQVEDDDEELSDASDASEEFHEDSRPAKRIKAVDYPPSHAQSASARASEDDGNDDFAPASASHSPDAGHRAFKKHKKYLGPSSLTAQESKSSKSGVIYLSRIPPFMKPTTLRTLLTPHAPTGIGRLFLTPESSTSHRQRTRAGGNKKRSFTDGWVEFLSKKEARRCAETLNTQIIGGKKGGYYHDDVWNMIYLKGFRWSHLTEQIANENAERASRMRAEVAQTNRENRRFLANVERAKKLQGMEEKKRIKRQRAEAVDGEVRDRSEEAERNTVKDFTRHFRQNEVRGRPDASGAPVVQPPEVQRVLSKIF